MKKTRKMFSLLLALVLCMAMAVPASAAGADSGVRTKTYHLGDSVVVTVVTGPSDSMPMPLKNSDYTNNALAAPVAKEYFELKENEGPNCAIHVWNDSDDTAMEVTLKVTVNGETEEETERVSANSKTNFFIIDRSGKDLVGEVVTTIRAAGGSSVRYTYTAEQYKDR